MEFKVMNQKGQTLLEILLAFSVSILVLSTVILGIITSLSNTQYTKNQGLANSYAQEGMAIVRQIRDSSWPDFYSKNGDYCLPQNAVSLGDTNSDCKQAGKVGEIFVRSIKIEKNSSDYCSEGIPPTPTLTPATILSGSRVTVKVSWTDNKCPSSDNIYCHKVELITCFSNIDQKSFPAPTAPNACADGTNDKNYNVNMVGCDGAASNGASNALCATGWHVCSVNEFVNRGGNSATNPNENKIRYLSDVYGPMDWCDGSSRPVLHPPGSYGIVTSNSSYKYYYDTVTCGSANPGWYFNAGGQQQGVVCCN